MAINTKTSHRIRISIQAYDRDKATYRPVRNEVWEYATKEQAEQAANRALAALTQAMSLEDGASLEQI